MLDLGFDVTGDELAYLRPLARVGRVFIADRALEPDEVDGLREGIEEKKPRLCAIVESALGRRGLVWSNTLEERDDLLGKGEIRQSNFRALVEVRLAPDSKSWTVWCEAGDQPRPEVTGSRALEVGKRLKNLDIRCQRAVMGLASEFSDQRSRFRLNMRQLRSHHIHIRLVFSPSPQIRAFFSDVRLGRLVSMSELRSESVAPIQSFLDMIGCSTPDDEWRYTTQRDGEKRGWRMQSLPSGHLALYRYHESRRQSHFWGLTHAAPADHLEVSSRAVNLLALETLESLPSRARCGASQSSRISA